VVVAIFVSRIPRGRIEERNMTHCLVVDDSQVIRDVGQRIFQELGFSTSEAADAATALDMCADTAPDIILLDADIPETGGIEFLRALRLTSNGRATIVLFLMTENEVAVITEALSAGASDFILKPIDRDSVAEKLNEMGVGPSESQDAASA